MEALGILDWRYFGLLRPCLGVPGQVVTESVTMDCSLLGFQQVNRWESAIWQFLICLIAQNVPSGNFPGQEAFRNGLREFSIRFGWFWGGRGEWGEGVWTWPSHGAPLAWKQMSGYFLFVWVIRTGPGWDPQLSFWRPSRRTSGNLGGILGEI